MVNLMATKQCTHYLYIYLFFRMVTGYLLHLRLKIMHTLCTSTRARLATVAVCRTAVWGLRAVSISMSTVIQMPSAAAIDMVKV